MFIDPSGLVAKAIWELMKGAGGSAIDGIQTGLDVIGLAPFVGEVADGTNALISLGRGNYGDAALSAGAMIPFVGWAATGTKFGKKALKYSDEATSTVNSITKSGSKKADTLVLPETVKSGKGVKGKFTVDGHSYRIDTNKVAPGEGGFHLHIFRKKEEIAKITGRGGYVKTHKGNTLLKPSQIDKKVRKEANKLVKHVRKNTD